ncbi:MAG: energy transducer TonB [Candidatus Omnitrophica bacterium]|nr:energy transducer TonB [Candidatus Omnitrophota bacterium]
MKKIIRTIFIAVIISSFFFNVSFSQEMVPPPQPQAAADAAQIQSAAASSKISLDIKGMDITDVLKMLALRSGLNIVAGKNVRGKVTIFLKDVDMMDAMEIILVSNDLAYDKRGNIINVMTDREYEVLYGERFVDTTKLKIIKPRYVKAAEVSKALTQMKSRIGKIVIDDVSNTIIVMDSPQTVERMEELVKQMDMPTKTRVFALNYAKAENIKTKVEPFLTKGIGTIQIDERTNKVIITDLEDNMPAIDSAIKEFDEKTKEVLIEAKILQITLNDEYKAGINWDVVFNGIRAQLGMNFNIITGNIIPTTAATSPTGGALHVGSLDKTNYEAMIKFLQTYGKTNLLSSPRIATINNEEAKILVGTNQPYATSQTTVGSAGAPVKSYQVTFLDLGVKLYVTPTINRDGFVTMKIKPEVSSLSGEYEYGADKDKVPVVKTSQAETTVMIKDGTTIVIAGLIENRQEETVNQVPGLGSAPVIGPLFRNRSTGSESNPEKNELVIFLTPRIISGEVFAADVERYGGLTQTLEKQLTQKEIKEVATLETEAATKKDIEAGFVTESKTVIAEPVETPARTPVMNIDEYYKNIRGKIFEKVGLNYPSQPVQGEVKLSFCVLEDGSLKGAPVVLKPVDQGLKASAIKSVQSAAPFPAFPKSFGKKEETFKISIIYE